jgi:hypothetical protein
VSVDAKQGWTRRGYGRYVGIGNVLIDLPVMCDLDNTVGSKDRSDR